MKEKVFIYFLSAFCFFLFAEVQAATYHTITIDGNLSDFLADELTGQDSRADSPWGGNEVYDLYVTWDSANLYIGASGLLSNTDGGHKLVIYMDCGNYANYGSTKSAYNYSESGSTWWRTRTNFRNDFLPDYFLGSYLFNNNSNDNKFFKVEAWNLITNKTSLITAAASGGGNNITGYLEYKIPFSVLFDIPSGVPPGATVKFAVMMTGVDTSPHDMLPDQSGSFPEWDQIFTLDSYLKVVIDADRDGAADPGVSTSPDLSPPAIPSGFQVTAIGAGTVSLSWNKVNNFDVSGYLIYLSTGPVSLLSYTKIKEELKSGTTSQISGLTNHLTYYFAISSRDSSGNESAKSDYVRAVPYQGPEFFPIVPSKIFYMGRPFSVSAATGMPDISEMEFHYRLSGNAGDFSLAVMSKDSSGNYTAAVSSGTVIDGGILEYYVTARNQGGYYSVYPSTGYGRILMSSVYSETVDYYKTSVVYLPDTASDGNTKARFEIPAGALSGSVPFAVRSVGGAEIDSSGQAADSIKNPEIASPYPSAAYDISAGGGSVEFLKPVRAYFKYFNEQNETEYALFLRTATGWLRLQSGLDPVNNLVSAAITRSGRYAIFRYNSNLETGDLMFKGVSRPVFIPDRGEYCEFLISETADKKISIFDMDGGLVRKLSGAVWDGRNESGFGVPSGPYVYQITLDGKIKSGMVCIVK